MSVERVAVTQIAIDARHPLRSVLALSLRYRWRVIGALVVFVVKDTPLWLMPVLNAAIIHIVVQRGSLEMLALYLAIATVSLTQNYPTHWLFVRWFSSAVRQTGAD